jgi:hypothetical protein
VQRPIHIRDELVLEAHLKEPCILLRREREQGSVHIDLSEVRYLADAMCSMAACSGPGRRSAVGRFDSVLRLD